MDHKGTLQNFYMRLLRSSNTCTYSTSPVGPPFSSSVVCPAVMLANGCVEAVEAHATGPTKKEAEKRAAEKALKILQDRGYDVLNTRSVSRGYPPGSSEASVSSPDQHGSSSSKLATPPHSVLNPQAVHPPINPKVYLNEFFQKALRVSKCLSYTVTSNQGGMHCLLETPPLVDHMGLRIFPEGQFVGSGGTKAEAEGAAAKQALEKLVEARLVDASLPPLPPLNKFALYSPTPSLPYASPMLYAASPYPDPRTMSAMPPGTPADKVIPLGQSPYETPPVLSGVKPVYTTSPVPFHHASPLQQATHLASPLPQSMQKTAPRPASTSPPPLEGRTEEWVHSATPARSATPSADAVEDLAVSISSLALQQQQRTPSPMPSTPPPASTPPTTTAQMLENVSRLSASSSTYSYSMPRVQLPPRQPLRPAHLPPPLKTGVYQAEAVEPLEPLACPEEGEHTPAGALVAVRSNPKGALQELYMKAVKSSSAVMFQWTHWLEGGVFGARVTCPALDSGYLVLPQLQGEGGGRSKKAAEQNAANEVLKQLETTYGVRRGRGGGFVVLKGTFAFVL